MKTLFTIIKNLFLGLALLAFSLAASQAYALGSTPVKVVNPEEIAKAQGMQHPFQRMINCAAISGSSYQCAGDYTVPINKRLVIEFINFSCNFHVEGIAGGTFNRAGIVTSVADYQAYHTLAGVTPSSSGNLTNSQLTRIYADPGTEVFVDASVRGGTVNCSFDISGQLIDVP